MKKWFSCIGIAVMLFAFSYYSEKRMSQAEIIIDPAQANTAILNSYSDYLIYSERYLAVFPETFSFGVPREEEFQAVLQNAHLYVDLSKEVIADPNVSIEVKRGVTSAMLGLPVDELADFVKYLNRLSLKSPELLELVKLASINYFIDNTRHRTNVMDYRLSEYADKPNVKSVFKEIYKNPNIDSSDRARDGWLYGLAH